MQNKPKRKNLRLKYFDYNIETAYFITICTSEKRCLFSTVGAIHESPEQARVYLNEYGNIVREVIEKIPTVFCVEIPTYVIMPNHLHLIVVIKNGDNGGSFVNDPYKRPTVHNVGAIHESPAKQRSLLSKVIGYLKMNVSKEIHKTSKIDVWQRGYYDHIIRNENDYFEVCEYIENNPQKWLISARSITG